uniref:Basic tail secreted protein n=1 Tax=Rhipicephalus zambeziensis TaxID=60191 RepID=A0A224Y1S4_9ACAR
MNALFIMTPAVLLLLLSFSLAQASKRDTPQPNCTATFKIPARRCKLICLTRFAARFIPLFRIINKPDGTKCKRLLSGMKGRCEEGRCVLAGVLGFFINKTPLKHIG